MMKDTYRNYIKHLESILQMYEEADPPDDLIGDAEAQGILARAEAAINRICGKDSAYTTRTKAILDGAYIDRFRAGLIVGIVKALKSDLEDGYLHSFSELGSGRDVREPG